MKRTGIAASPWMNRLAHSFGAWPAWWRRTAADRQWAWAFAMAAGLMALAGVAAWQWQALQLHAARQAYETTRAEAAQAERMAAEAARAALLVPGPWWMRLPSADLHQRNAAEQLTADALESAPKIGVQLLRLNLAPLPPVVGTPYRGTSVQAELRGAYPDVKRWLGELLARRPDALALKSIDVRRASGGASPGAEASIELRLFERVAQGPDR